MELNRLSKRLLMIAERMAHYKGEEYLTTEYIKLALLVDEDFRKGLTWDEMSCWVEQWYIHNYEKVAEYPSSILDFNDKKIVLNKLLKNTLAVNAFIESAELAAKLRLEQKPNSAPEILPDDIVAVFMGGKSGYKNAATGKVEYPGKMRVKDADDRRQEKSSESVIPPLSLNDLRVSFSELREAIERERKELRNRLGDLPGEESDVEYRKEEKDPSKNKDDQTEDFEPPKRDLLSSLREDFEQIFGTGRLADFARIKLQREQSKYGQEKNLVSEAKSGALDPVFSRKEEIDRGIQILLRRRKNNPLLIGQPGVGKTAVAHGIAYRIASGEVPEALKHSGFWQLDIAGLLAGTSYRGQLEEKILGFLEKLKPEKGRKNIIFIDNIHVIWQAGMTRENRGGISDILKPYLSGDDYRFIGATSYEDYRSSIERDPGLARRFQKIDICEPTIEQTIKIVNYLRPRYEKYHDVLYTDEAIEEAVKLAAKHIHEPANPDKTIDVIDEVASMHNAFPERFRSRLIDVNEVRSVVSKIARIPNMDIVDDERKKLQRLESSLKSVVFGQDEAIEHVVSAVKLSRAGLQRANKPVANLLFAGPTGVGKTELAKQLASTLGIEFIRYDMSEYSERHAVSRLIGADPGYVGYQEGGVLTNAIARTPHSVLLLDEIEKADPSIFNILLQVMDAARLSDNRGRETSFRNVILIMTSNVGTRNLEQNRVGFERQAPLKWDSRELKHTFSPEFRNRLDAVISFNSLEMPVVIKIVEKIFSEIEFQLSEKGIHFELNDEVKLHLAELGYDSKFGARPLDRVIQQKVKVPIADEILFGSLVDGGEVKLGLTADGELDIQIKPTKK